MPLFFGPGVANTTATTSTYLGCWAKGEAAPPDLFTKATGLHDRTDHYCRATLGRSIPFRCQGKVLQLKRSCEGACQETGSAHGNLPQRHLCPTCSLLMPNYSSCLASIYLRSAAHQLCLLFLKLSHGCFFFLQAGAPLFFHPTDLDLRQFAANNHNNSERCSASRTR